MKTVFIGDIHGDIDLVLKVRRQYADWHKVFVGDILDSYVHSPSEQLMCVTVLLQMIEKENTTVLFGNHEISYLIEGQQCSGFNPTTYEYLRELSPKILNNFKLFYFDTTSIKDKKILVTHAGLSNAIWKKVAAPVDRIPDVLNYWWSIFTYGATVCPLEWVGRTRGGLDTVGGPLWCHFPREFTDIDGVVQIFGHTPDDEFRFTAQSWCINISESRAKYVLELEDGVFSVNPI